MSCNARKIINIVVHPASEIIAVSIVWKVEESTEIDMSSLFAI